PLASAAANAVLDVMQETDLMQQVSEQGEHLGQALARLAAKHPKLAQGARGRGLLQALVFNEGVDVRAIVETLRDRGVLLTVAGGVALRFTPPLNISRELLD